jgi:hypothetical protein
MTLSIYGYVKKTKEGGGRPERVEIESSRSERELQSMKSL